MAKRERTEDHGIVFSGPGETSVGWFLPVPSSFREQLDIQYTRRKGGAAWTQGVPAQYSFTQGGILYDPAEVRALPWGEGQKILRLVVQIEAATPDQLDGDLILPGTVTFRVDHYDSGKVIATERLESTQRGFVAFLRQGEIPAGERMAEIPIETVNGQRRRWGIEYADADGVVTERAVQPIKLFLRNGSLYLLAFCEQAGARRTFRADRIRVLADLGTGEVRDSPVEWLMAMGGDRLCEIVRQPYRYARPNADPKEELKRGLRVLLAMAVADGPATAAEKEVMVRYVVERAALVGMSLRCAPSDLVDLLTAKMRPSREVAAAALRKQAECDRSRWPQHHAILLRCATQMALVSGGGGEVQAILSDVAWLNSPERAVAEANVVR